MMCVGLALSNMPGSICLPSQGHCPEVDDLLCSCFVSLRVCSECYHCQACSLEDDRQPPLGHEGTTTLAGHLQQHETAAHKEDALSSMGERG